MMVLNLHDLYKCLSAKFPLFYLNNLFRFGKMCFERSATKRQKEHLFPLNKNYGAKARRNPIPLELMPGLSP